MPPLAHPQQTPTMRGEALAVPDGVETMLKSFTVQGGDIWLDEVACTGAWAAEFRLYIDGVYLETKHLAVSNANVVFRFEPGRKLKVGQTVDARVVHYHDGEVHDFEATLKFHR